ncbi:hypothetical protein [Meiothermus sp.]|uniref:hypothetical protein n=1 Tax=Meiothermus sp. TaxID=1955249 RepID=UPI0021DE969B|nr:hypothetical protein [Meiothermus sp.]GIW26352.1 MAG: hypothetical protein KatS3mg069_2619 [Meiothermus sp.]
MKGLLFATFLGLAFGLAQGVPLQSGQQYAAGTRVGSPWTGVSFVVPQGYQGRYDPEAEGFVMSSAKRDYLAVYALSSASPETFAEYLLEALSKQGMQLQLKGEPQQTQTTLSAQAVARTAQGALSFYFTAKQGPAGNLLAVVGLAATKDEAALKKVADGLLASGQLGTPQAEVWKRELGGVLLTLKSRNSAWSRDPNPGKSASFSSNTKETYVFCSNGQYAFSTKTERFLSNAAGYIESTDTDGHSGEWNLIANIIGTPILYLEASNGKSFEYVLRVPGQGSVALDDRIYTVGSSEQCN